MAQNHPRRQLLRAGAPRARRAVQPERQQRLQHRAPAQLQQRRARQWRSAWKRSRAMAPRMRAANTPSVATTSAAHRQRRHRRRHDLGRHRRLRRADRRRVGCAARRRPQLVVLRELRLAQPRHVRSRRSPLDAGLLSRRIPARLRDGRDDDSARPTAGQVLTPQAIVDGLRSGNSLAASGQLIDRLAFVACDDTRQRRLGNALLEAAALAAAQSRTPTSTSAEVRDDGREAGRASGRGRRRGDRRARSVGHELLAVHVRRIRRWRRSASISR